MSKILRKNGGLKKCVGKIGNSRRLKRHDSDTATPWGRKWINNTLFIAYGVGGGRVTHQPAMPRQVPSMPLVGFELEVLFQLLGEGNRDPKVTSVKQERVDPEPGSCK